MPVIRNLVLLNCRPEEAFDYLADRRLWTRRSRHDAHSSSHAITDVISSDIMRWLRCLTY